jgi:hypothetical protein
MRGSRLETRLFLVGVFLVLLVIAAAGWVVRSFAAMARWAGEGVSLRRAIRATDPRQSEERGLDL